MNFLTSFLSKFKLYIYAALLGAAIVGFLGYGHMRYEAGYTSAQTKQTDAILAYQKIVIAKDQEQKQKIEQLTTLHTQQLADLTASIKPAQEKIRVITRTIDRPVACDLSPDELRIINEAVHTANGTK
jgi:hypothetical protein